MTSINPQIRLRDSALEVLKTLEENGHEARFAGGCVRDHILGIVPKDYDIATTALPDQVMKIFRNDGSRDAKYKVIPTGIDHGTVTVVSKDGPVEITTLRQDINTDGRHALVELGGTSFEEDAARRDFTINAMFEDRHGEVYDFHNGREHIQRGLIAFVGDAETRIKEDYLRILRFFRFWARFAFEPEQGALNIIKQNLAGLEFLSQERITSELWGILQADKPQAALTSMQKIDIFEKVLPEAVLDGKIADYMDSLVEIDPLWRPVMRLASMLASSKTKVMEIEPIGIRLRLPHEQTIRIKAFIDALSKLEKIEEDVPEAMTFIDRIEGSDKEQSFLRYYMPSFEIWLRHHHASQALAKLKFLVKTEELKGHIRRTKLPLNGNDVMKHLNIGPSEKLGVILQNMKKAFRSEEWKTRLEGFNWLDHYKDISK